MSSALYTLLRENGLAVLCDEPMARRTTLRVGGPAAVWLDARGPQDVRDAAALAARCGAPWRVVGNGSNLLVRDGGLPGLTICVGQAMADVAIDGESVTAQAGARLAQLAQAAQAAGLAGLEALSGIPGTLGGALRMNAGAYGTEIGSLVEWVDVLDADGAMRRLTRAEMDFGYRQSALAGGGVAAKAALRLTPDDPGAIAGRMRDLARRRREKQPLALPSAGSFFKRPPGHFAGALIEQAGLKGEAIGGAQVSTLHAGFLVNTGGATAADFLALMERVQARVFESSGVMLEPEVWILGCDSSC